MVEINPYKKLDYAQQSLLNKINEARAKEVNKMIKEHIPKWKIFLLKKSQLFARILGIFSIIEPQTKLESDLIREKIVLCSGSKDNPKKIAETTFSVQDKRTDFITPLPKPLMMPSNNNFSLTMGEQENKVSFNFQVEKTFKNKIKYWLFCKFFPFKITKWE